MGSTLRAMFLESPWSQKTFCHPQMCLPIYLNLCAKHQKAVPEKGQVQGRPETQREGPGAPQRRQGWETAGPGRTVSRNQWAVRHPGSNRGHGYIHGMKSSVKRLPATHSGQKELVPARPAEVSKTGQTPEEPGRSGQCPGEREQLQVSQI